MRSLGGRAFAKTGAAGLYAAALPAGPRVPKALGIAIKIEGGDPKSRIRASVIVDVLRQLGVVTRDDGDLWKDLEEIAQSTERNLGGRDVGTYVPVFRLEGS